jgi:ribosome modulation factor
MSLTGDCQHKSCQRHRSCRWPYLAAYREANRDRLRAYKRGYDAGIRLAARQAERNDPE